MGWLAGVREPASTGVFRRLTSDAKRPILNFALITLVVRYLRSHVIY